MPEEDLHLSGHHAFRRTIPRQRPRGMTKRENHAGQLKRFSERYRAYPLHQSTRQPLKLLNFSQRINKIHDQSALF